MKAVVHGSDECVQALLKAGADFTVRDNEGHTALSIARRQKHDDVVELLKLHGVRE